MLSGKVPRLSRVPGFHSCRFPGLQGCRFREFHGSRVVDCRGSAPGFQVSRVVPSSKVYTVKRKTAATPASAPSKMFQPGVPASAFQRDLSKVPARLQRGSSRVRSNKVPARFQQNSSKVQQDFREGSSKGSSKVPALFRFSGACILLAPLPAPEIETQQNRCWEYLPTPASRPSVDGGPSSLLLGWVFVKVQR